jgi:hypothetical protein
MDPVTVLFWVVPAVINIGAMIADAAAADGKGS